MKGIMKLFLVPLVTLAFAGMSFAQATPATPATPAGPEKKAEMKADKPKATRVSGEIAAVDAKAGTLTVKAKDKEMSFTAETKGAKAALEKVKVGDKVRVSYTEKGGKLTAQSITQAKVTTAAKGKSEATGMEKKAEPKAVEKKSEKTEKK